MRPGVDAIRRGCEDLADARIRMYCKRGQREEPRLGWERWSGAGGGEEAKSRVCGGCWAASMYTTILVCLVVSKVFGIIEDQAPARILSDLCSSSNVIMLRRVGI